MPSFRESVQVGVDIDKVWEIVTATEGAETLWAGADAVKFEPEGEPMAQNSLIRMHIQVPRIGGWVIARVDEFDPETYHTRNTILEGPHKVSGFFGVDLNEKKPREETETIFYGDIGGSFLLRQLIVPIIKINVHHAGNRIEEIAGSQ